MIDTRSQQIEEIFRVFPWLNAAIIGAAYSNHNKWQAYEQLKRRIIPLLALMPEGQIYRDVLTRYIIDTLGI